MLRQENHCAERVPSDRNQRRRHRTSGHAVGQQKRHQSQRPHRPVHRRSTTTRHAARAAVPTCRDRRSVHWQRGEGAHSAQSFRSIRPRPRRAAGSFAALVQAAAAAPDSEAAAAVQGLVAAAIEQCIGVFHDPLMKSLSRLFVSPEPRVGTRPGPHARTPVVAAGGGMRGRQASRRARVMARVRQCGSALTLQRGWRCCVENCQASPLRRR